MGTRDERVLPGIDPNDEADTLRDLFENAPCAVHCLDPSGVFLRVNATEARWLGRPAAELVGRVRFVDTLWPESAAAYARRLGEGHLSVSNLTLQLRGAGGSRKHVVLSTNAVCDARGNLVVLRGAMVERGTASGVMPRPDVDPETLRRRELWEAIAARAEGIDAALRLLLDKLDYLGGEIYPSRGLQQTLAELRDAAIGGRILAREMVELGGGTARNR